MGFGISPTRRDWRLLSLPEASEAMDLDTNALAVNDMLSNGTMEFYEAVPEDGGAVEIGAFIFREHHEDVSPSLQKIPCRIYFFRKCAVTTAYNSPFEFTQALANDLMGFIDIETADWEELEGGKDAFCRKEFNKPIVLDQDIKIIQCIAVAKALKTFTVNHTLIPQLLVAE